LGKTVLALSLESASTPFHFLQLFKNFFFQQKFRPNYVCLKMRHFLEKIYKNLETTDVVYPHSLELLLLSLSLPIIELLLLSTITTFLVCISSANAFSLPTVEHEQKKRFCFVSTLLCLFFTSNSAFLLIGPQKAFSFPPPLPLPLRGTQAMPLFPCGQFVVKGEGISSDEEVRTPM